MLNDPFKNLQKAVLTKTITEKCIHCYMFFIIIKTCLFIGRLSEIRSSSIYKAASLTV